MPLVLCTQFGIQKKVISNSKHFLSVLFIFSYLPFVLLPSENGDLSVSKWVVESLLKTWISLFYPYNMCICVSAVCLESVLMTFPLIDCGTTGKS